MAYHYTGNLEEFKLALMKNQYNGAQLTQTAVDFLKTITDGEVDIVDASSPALYLLEMIASTAANNANQIDTVTRQLYPKLARTRDDLNRHMTDKQNLGSFAMGATTTINYILDMPSILKLAVEDITDGTRKLVIPEDTVIEVGGYRFGILYPIVIRVLENDTLSILADNAVENPLGKLTTNEIVFTYRTSTDTQGLRTDLVDITLPVYQLEHVNYTSALNAGTGFVSEFNFSNKYVYTRVFTGDDRTGWRELHTTYNTQVYDIGSNTATAVLAVLDGKVRVTIPQIFFSTGKLGASIKTVVYSTKGAVNLALGNYTTADFRVTIADSNPLTTKYSVPLRQTATSMAYSHDLCIGGSDGSTFEEIREAVVVDGVVDEEIVTDEQLELALKKREYDLVTWQDYLNKLLFIATKPLPNITLTDSTVSPSVAMLPLVTSIDALTQLDTVKDNTTRLTILPTTLYRVQGGVVSILTDAEREELYNSSNNEKITQLNGGGYIYSPYYHVLSATSSYFSYRSYYLDDPTFDGRFFKDANDSTLIRINTKDVNINKVDAGWELLVSTTVSSDASKLLDHEVNAQISIRGRHENRPSFLTGTLAKRCEDGSFVFRFIIESNHDIDDEDDYLVTTNLFTNKNDKALKFINLSSTFDISYSVIGHILPSPLDNILGTDFLPSGSTALTHEELLITLGKPTKYLFNNSRSVIGEEQYATYSHDIPAVWEHDVPETGEGGKILFKPNPDYPATSDKPLIYDIKHHAGDPKLDPDGNPIYTARKGNAIIDPLTGKPQVIAPRYVNYCMDFMFLDAVLLFVTEKTSQRFAKEIPKQVMAYLENDMSYFAPKLLSLGEINFYPRRCMGNIVVDVSKGVSKSIRAVQELEFRVYVRDGVFTDSKTRDAITRNIKSIASDLIRHASVSTDEILGAIKDKIKGDIISIAMDGFGENRDLDRFTVNNSSEGATIGLELVLQTDNTLRLKDTIEVQFLKASDKSVE